MRGYSEAVKADVRRADEARGTGRAVARISEELGIHVITLYKWRKTWRLQGEVVRHPRRNQRLERCDKFTVVLETLA